MSHQVFYNHPFSGCAQYWRTVNIFKCLQHLNIETFRRSYTLVEDGFGVITFVVHVPIFVTWRNTLCVWQAVSWWATDLSRANSATVWVAMCQCEVLLCCVGAAEYVLGSHFLFLYTQTHIHTILVSTLIDIMHLLTLTPHLWDTFAVFVSVIITLDSSKLIAGVHIHRNNNVVIVACSSNVSFSVKHE